MWLLLETNDLLTHMKHMWILDFALFRDEWKPTSISDFSLLYVSSLLSPCFMSETIEGM